MKKSLVLIFSFLLISCSSFDKSSSNPNAPTTKVTENGPMMNINQVKPASVKTLSGKFNIDGIIKGILSPSWETERWFEVVDNKNGYAKMGGYIEGSFEYFLFVGSGRNLLVEVTWGCGPACEQVVKFYEIKGSSAKPIGFENIVSTKIAAQFGAEIEKCATSQSFNSWANKNCSIMLDFPKVGTSVALYNAKVVEDDRFQDEWGQDGAKLSELEWDRKQFRFEVKN